MNPGAYPGAVVHHVHAMQVPPPKQEGRETSSCHNIRFVLERNYTHFVNSIAYCRRAIKADLAGKIAYTIEKFHKISGNVETGGRSGGCSS